MNTLEKPAPSGEPIQMLDVHDDSEKPDQVLPSPVSAPQPRTSAVPKLSSAAIIPIWIILSSSVIIFNNYLYNTLQFRFPVFLVTWHLTFAVSFLLCAPRGFGGPAWLGKGPIHGRYRCRAAGLHVAQQYTGNDCRSSCFRSTFECAWCYLRIA